ncbi:Ig-like domain-containing protein [Eubacteriales bacterium OttesenSCG-928-M02]|nr:Ig-like domain-containing protein [Eubacteriales bacterium OttesenSCG-928-M02]
MNKAGGQKESSLPMMGYDLYRTMEDVGMMGRKQGKGYRILGAFLALVLVCTMAPLPVVFAGQVSGFTIQLSDTQITGQATLTNASNPSDTQQADIVNGVIAFPEEVDDATPYLLVLSDMGDYVDYTTSITPSTNPYPMDASVLTIAPPRVTSLGKPTIGWTTQSVRVSGTVAATRFYQVAEVRYSTNATDYAAANGGQAANYASGNDAFDFEMQTADNLCIGDVYVWAVDTQGNKSPVESINLQMDTQKPTITGIAIEKTQESLSTKIINFLTFGTFFHEAVLVKVSADDGAGAGVKGVTLIYSTGNDEKTLYTETLPAVFRLPLEDAANGQKYTLEAVAVDKVGNASNPAYPADFAGINSNDIMLEDTPPEVEISIPGAAYEKDGQYWCRTTDALAYTVTVTDEDSGLHSAKITGPNGTPEEETYTTFTQEDIISLDTGTLALGENTLQVWVRDNAGNETQVSTKIWVDDTAPTIAGMEIEAADDTAPADALNVLPYGIFFNDAVLVTVTATATSGAGIKEISLYDENDTLLDTQPAVDGKAIFTIPDTIVPDGLLFEKGLKAKATDNVGNTMAAPAYSQEYGNLVLMVETEKPTIAITAGTPAYSGNNGDWYTAKDTFDVVITDDYAGIRSVEMELNGQQVLLDDNNKAIDADFSLAQTGSESFTISTDIFGSTADGTYALTVKVVDNAGNVTEESHAIHIDTLAPEITGFSFAAEGVGGSLQGQDVSVDKTDYGYYFKADTDVTITAVDEGAGVSTITYYTVDEANGTSSPITAPAVDGQVTFTIPANFRGQIYAKAKDYVEKEASQYESPYSLIVENPAKHGEETHLELSKAATPHRDNAGRELYAQDVAVDVTLVDTFSGLRRVEWRITSPQDTANNTTGGVEVAGKDGLTGDVDGWNVLETEGNLATKMTGRIWVKNNSNDITLWVRVTDRAGNTNEKTMNFSIDKTAPTIAVTYDNNIEGPISGYYKANRTATITITERNFRPGDVQIAITQSGGGMPSISGWIMNTDGADPDKTTYRATIAYTEEADYTFAISYTDNAGNPAAVFAKQSFTIDKTAPVIVVTYDNNRAANGKYYGANRTATITITEHNFDPSLVKITGTATDDGVRMTFPALSGWSSNGDVHKATIAYRMDGAYTFDISCSDKAGNASQDFLAQAFTIDKTTPTIEILGVQDRSANNGDVVPIVRFLDTNINPSSVSLTLVGASRQNVPLEGSFSDIHNGRVFTFQNFKREKEIDDIYILSASMSDFAGNRTTKTILFSVNRFGSVYTFDAPLQRIEGTYVKDGVDVVVTETNVDSLARESIRVKLVQNGIPRDLIEGTDYTVAKTGGDGTWSQYRYTMSQTLFQEDGSYMVTLYSLDAAGNINENIQESKQAEIVFGIDKTPPVVVVSGVKSGAQYPTESLQVDISAMDNLVLKDVGIYLNDEKIEGQMAERQQLVIPASNTKQALRIVAVDAAGNESAVEIADFLVTENWLLRWFYNVPLFIGTLGGLALVAILTGWLAKKRKARANI